MLVARAGRRHRECRASWIRPPGQDLTHYRKPAQPRPVSQPCSTFPARQPWCTSSAAHATKPATSWRYRNPSGQPTGSSSSMTTTWPRPPHDASVASLARGSGRAAEDPTVAEQACRARSRPRRATRGPQSARHAEPPEPGKDPQVIAVSPPALSGFSLRSAAGAGSGSLAEARPLALASAAVSMRRGGGRCRYPAPGCPSPRRVTAPGCYGQAGRALPIPSDRDRAE